MFDTRPLRRLRSYAANLPVDVVATRLRRLCWLPLLVLIACGGGRGSAGVAATGATGATMSALAATATAAAASWTDCAAEGQFCGFSGTKQVRYGAGETFVVRTLSGGTACGNAVFGDPVYGVAKSCAYADDDGDDAASWTLCATEGGQCAFDGEQAVRYGSGTQTVTQRLTGPVACGNAVFGDPAFGIVKSCWVRTVASADAGWTACADEGQRCAFTGTYTVRYGAGTQYASGTYTDGVDCGNAVFGDPAYGVVKRCSIGAAAAVSVPPVPIPTRSRQVGTNLGGIAYYGNNFPFADLMKSGGGWSARRADGSFGGSFPSVAADGTPTVLAAGQQAVAAVAWGGTAYPSGRYTVLWDGSGTLSFPMSTVRIVESAAHRIVVETTDARGAMWVGIDATDPADPVRNVRFLLPDTEATYAGQPFNPAYLSRIAPFSTLRFMDWGATNGSPVREWADRALPGDATYTTSKGVPLELMIELANRMQADPWFCIPHLASDDYVRQFAALLHARLDPALKPHIEYSNEVWNTGFDQTRWALAQSDAQGLAHAGGQPSIFYAKRAVEVFKIVRQAYGADAGRLVRVLAGQAAWTQFLENALAYADTATQVDAVAIAPYYTAPAAGDVAQVDATLALAPGRIVDQMLANVRGEVKNWMSANAALAARYKLPLKAYESGAGNVSYYFPADKQQAVYAQFAAAQRDPRMKDLVAEYHAQWKSVGGQAMLQYYDMAGWSIYGLWGALESVAQDPASSPIYQGLLSAIDASPMPTKSGTSAAAGTASRR